MKRYSQYSKTVTINGQPAQSGLPFVDLLYQGGKIVFHEVTEQEQGRLDRIAYIYYSDWTLWYILALFNNIMDPLSIQAGDIIEIPLNSVNQTTDLIPFTYNENF